LKEATISFTALLIWSGIGFLLIFANAVVCWINDKSRRCGRD
jgi:hypothetical protein